LRSTRELLAAKGIGTAYHPHVALAADEELDRLANAEPIDLHPTSVWTRGITLSELVTLLRYVGGAEHVRAAELAVAPADPDLHTRVRVKTLSVTAHHSDLDLSKLEVFDGLERLELIDFRHLTGTAVHLSAVRHAALKADTIELSSLPQALQSLAIDWPESDFTNSTDLEELTSLQLGPNSALTSLEGLERFACLTRLDLSHLSEATRLDLTPLERCAALDVVVVPAWTDLSQVTIPAGLDITVAAEGEVFGLPLDQGAPLLGLVADRWYEELQGIADDELELRAWNDYLWPGSVKDDLTAQDRLLDAQIAGETEPVIKGDDATIGWSVHDGTDLQPEDHGE
jgi:hypothetical protein